MNAWNRLLTAMAPSVFMMLAEATVVLVAAILLALVMRRSAAGRHAVVMWALVAVGLSPIATSVLATARIPSIIWARTRMPFAVVPSQPVIPSPSPDAIHVSASSPSPLISVFFALWAIGASICLVRLAWGLYITWQIRRSATTPSQPRIASMRDQVEAAVGNRPPEILSSDRVDVPMAIGCLRPVVLLPTSLLAQLDDQQLLPVLVHECAHALRRDTATGLYQRILAGLLWFHPLVHVANHLLDREREEICDNYVLRVVGAQDYSRTLLAVAESFSGGPSRWFAPGLLGATRRLEGRIRRLLNPRRCTMTRLSSRSVALTATGFMVGVLVLSCFAAVPAAQDTPANLSYMVKPGAVYTQGGDQIIVDEVRGTSDKLSAGNTYEVSGRYKLVSHDEAELAINVMVSYGSPRSVHHPLPDQQTKVARGEGRFTLKFQMWGDGNPHVSFYPTHGGESFASAYF